MRDDGAAATAATAVRAALLSARQVSKTYRMPDHDARLVLDRIDFALREGEIVALLGKSGSGKSTFLRLLAGLVPPSAGEVLYRDRPVRGPVRGVAMVFQSFALFPWLTVRGNVELGLEALGVPPRERRARAEAAIHLIGLDGFEDAYPKELSGGMRQRVGFARALVVEPEVLLLDEPFSALDVLTAETLRSDLMELWQERRIPTKGILLVSHNIEEAVDLADRIIILSSNPGRIRAELGVDLPRPRDWTGPGFRRLVDEVYAQLTTPERAGGGRRVGALAAEAAAAAGAAAPEPVPIGHRLPDATIQSLTGLVEILAEPPYAGRADLPQLAEVEGVASEEMLELVEALQILGLADAAGGDIELTAAGRRYAAAEAEERRRILAALLPARVGLAAHIRRVLQDRPNRRAPASRFLRELEDHLSEDEAERVLDTVVDWSRHAELFGYDYDTETLHLEDA